VLEQPFALLFCMSYLLGSEVYPFGGTIPRAPGRQTAHTVERVSPPWRGWCVIGVSAREAVLGWRRCLLGWIGSAVLGQL
jgi:hypothetical protein